MNDEMLRLRVYQAMAEQCEKRGYAAPVDVGRLEALK